MRENKGLCLQSAWYFCHNIASFQLHGKWKMANVRQILEGRVSWESQRHWARLSSSWPRWGRQIKLAFRAQIASVCSSSYVEAFLWCSRNSLVVVEGQDCNNPIIETDDQVEKCQHELLLTDWVVKLSLAVCLVLTEIPPTLRSKINSRELRNKFKKKKVYIPVFCCGLETASLCLCFSPRHF